MNALELADELTATVGVSGESTYAISVQDAAIKTLREALTISRDYAEAMGEFHSLEDDALAATEV